MVIEAPVTDALTHYGRPAPGDADSLELMLVVDVEDLGIELAHSSAHRAGLDISLAQARTVASFFNGDYDGNPQRLAALFPAGDVDAEVLALVLPVVWRYKLDGCSLPVDTWRQMFLSAPFTVDSMPRARSRWPCRLYRGATAANRAGLSWTTNLGIATHFARSRQACGHHGQVWVTVVPPQRLLARITDEDEYVVDARNLHVRPVQLETWLEKQIARLPSVRLRIR